VALKAGFQSESGVPRIFVDCPTEAGPIQHKKYTWTRHGSRLLHRTRLSQRWSWLTHGGALSPPTRSTYQVCDDILEGLKHQTRVMSCSLVWYGDFT